MSYRGAAVVVSLSHDGWRLSRRRFVSLEFRPPRAAVKLRRPSIRRLRVSFRARREDHGKLLFIEIRQHVEFGHDTSDKTRSPPVVICRSKGVSDGVSWQVFGGLPGPFRDRFRDLQAEGFPTSHFLRCPMKTCQSRTMRTLGFVSNLLCFGGCFAVTQ